MGRSTGTGRGVLWVGAGRQDAAGALAAALPKTRTRPCGAQREQRSDTGRVVVLDARGATSISHHIAIVDRETYPRGQGRCGHASRPQTRGEQMTASWVFWQAKKHPRKEGRIRSTSGTLVRVFDNFLVMDSLLDWEEVRFRQWAAAPRMAVRTVSAGLPSPGHPLAAIVPMKVPLSTV